MTHVYDTRGDGLRMFKSHGLKDFELFDSQFVNKEDLSLLIGFNNNCWFNKKVLSQNNNTGWKLGVFYV